MEQALRCRPLNGRLLWSGFALLLAASCTVALETDRKQCSSDQDCANFGAQFSSYACVASWCEPAQCQSDQDCQSRGGELSNDICSAELSRCIDPASCQRDSDCTDRGPEYASFQCRAGSCVEDFSCTETAECVARGGPYAELVCVGNTCVEAGCKQDADCAERGPRFMCIQGLCEDPIWGCIGEDADVTPAEGNTLTYRTPVVDLFTDALPPDLSISVCLRPDPDCVQPVSTTFTPVPDTSLVDITIPIVTAAGFDGFLLVQSPGYLPAYFHFVTPITQSNVDDPAAEIVLFTSMTVAALSATVPDVDINPDLGVALFRAFDCQGNPAAGVTALPDPAGEALFFSVDESNLPDPNVSSTGPAGIAGLANLPTGISTMTLSLEEGQQELVKFSVTVKGNATTLMNFKP